MYIPSALTLKHCTVHSHSAFVYWSLAIREELRLRVFEEKVLRKTLGPRGEEVTREWRKTAF